MKLINQKVWKGVGLTQIRQNMYGVEIELENYRGQNILTEKMKEYWMIADDPSLRQGIELVSKPLTQIKVREALKIAHERINYGSLTSSSRCGVHVHVNMLNFTWGQMWSFIALYTFLEPEIFARFAKDRDENHFCVPVFWNTKMVADMGRDINILRNFTVGDINYNAPARRGGALFTDNLGGPPDGEFSNPPRNKWFPFRDHLTSIGKFKYGALTTYRTPDLGTVELRILPGTTNMDKIEDWVSFVGRMKYQAMKYADPLELQKVYEDEGPAALWAKLKVGLRPYVSSADKDDAEESAYKLIGLKETHKEDYNWDIGEK